MPNKFFSTEELLSNANVIYEFVDLFSRYETTVRDYGEDNFLSMNEIHLLSHIEQHPGITASQLAENVRRSRGFISQCINKLEAGAYIIRVSQDEDNKKKSMYVTQKGKDLCVAHMKFDEQNLIKTYNYLLRDCTHEEIEHFYKVMGVYNNIMNASARKRQRMKLEQDQSCS